MSSLNRILEEKVMPTAVRIAGQRHLQSLRDGIALTMPLIIIGSLFLILANLPIPGYADFMAGLFGKQWADQLSYPVSATCGIMALVATFGILTAWQKSIKWMLFQLEPLQLLHFCWRHLSNSVYTRWVNKGGTCLRRHSCFVNGQ